MKKANLLKCIAFVLAIGTLTAGCAKQSDNSTATASSESSTAQASSVSSEGSGVTTLIAATEGTTPPMEYLDSNQKLTGYEVEVLRAVDQLLPQYQIKFEVTQFSSIFGGIDSGEYQIGFNLLSRTKDREAKYIFPKHSDYYEKSGLFATPGLTKKHPIKTIADLGGLKTASNTKGDTWQLFLTAYNAKYTKNPINVTYSSADWSVFYQQTSNGTIDILKGPASRMKMYEDTYHIKLDFVPFPESSSTDPAVQEAIDHLTYQTYFAFSKNGGQKIADAVDGAMETLKKNGTLSELSKKFMGADYSGADRADW